MRNIFLFLLIALHSRMTESHISADSGCEFTLQNAQNYFQQNAADLRPVEYMYSKSPTKGTEENIIPISLRYNRNKINT